MANFYLAFLMFLVVGCAAPQSSAGDRQEKPAEFSEHVDSSQSDSGQAEAAPTDVAPINAQVDEAIALQDILVESWEVVDTMPLNEQIDDAANAGFEWPKSALSVMLIILEGDEDTRRLTLSQVANTGEVPDEISFVMIRDGLLDDSVRGDWHQAILYRQDDGTWRLHELHRAFRCYRGESLDQYSGDVCP